MGFCPDCGKEVFPAAIYCSNCGHPLGASATIPQVARVSSQGPAPAPLKTASEVEFVEPHNDTFEVFHPSKDMTVYVTDKKIRIDARKHAKDYHTPLTSPVVGGAFGMVIEATVRSSVEKRSQKKANGVVADIGSSEEGVGDVPYEAISAIIVNRKGFTISKVDGRSARIKLPKEELHHFIQTIKASELTSKLKVE